MAITRTASIVLDARGLARALVLPAYQLKVLRGPNKGFERRLSARRVLLGSDPAADFSVPDPTVSAVHCELVLDDRGVRVRDLGAKNGVVLAGRRVVEAYLDERDELQLGASVVRFRLASELHEEPLERRDHFGRLRGGSAVMRELYAQLSRAARSDATVLLQGETGAGKELAAEAIATQGPRAERPLQVVDCGRLPSTLAESELFGHEKGAFTGAAEQRAGAFERAGDGTLFLDEIGELPLEVQPKLLGALERRVFQRVGGAERLPFRARVVAATHRELEREVNAGRFRADLFYRLAVIQIGIPPLRAHREDVPGLVSQFLEELPGLHAVTPELLDRWCSADWPGNVRELRAAVERAVAGVEAPPPAASGARLDLDEPWLAQKDRLLAGLERDYLSHLLEACQGNVSEAARRSGLNRAHLHELVRRHGLGARR